MFQCKWLLFLIVPVVITSILTLLYIFIKRTNGDGFFLSKFSAFTRIRFDSLEEKRQTYCPANNKCQCHPKGSATHIEPNLLCKHRSPTLYISFAGAAMMVYGVRTTEWRGSMKEVHHDTNDEFDALFFTDPAQCFYLQDPNYQWQGLTYYRDLIKLYSTLYQRIILIGASIGGSMVCMCADLATLSIAFNPIVDPVLLGLPWRFMGAYCPAGQAEVVLNQVHNTMEKINTYKTDHDCALHIHWSQLSKSDQRQAHQIVGGGKHNKPKQTECLTSVLDFDINDANMNNRSGVHIWLHKYKEHALALALKRTHQLIPLLKCHIGATSLDLNTISHKLGEKPQQDSVIIDMPS